MLLPAGGNEASRQAVLWVVVGVFSVSGLVAFLGSRGRHLSWIVFFAIAALAASAARGATGQELSIAADVVSVTVAGSPAGYDLSVGIASADTGCAQYANWWEVVDLEGSLIYRRILTHSHVTEQPFVRHGGPVEVSADAVVWVRAHMHPTGYGGTAFKGSVAHGFVEAEPAAGFAADLADQEPLPQGCAN
jgi:hypothetical protein